MAVRMHTASLGSFDAIAEEKMAWTQSRRLGLMMDDAPQATLAATESRRPARALDRRRTR